MYEILDLFKQYSGNGLAIGLFVLSFLYLLLTEKEHVKRIVLVYVSLVTMFLFFCPLFAAAVYKYMDDEIYYRILWLVPMTAVIAYAGMKLMGQLPKTWMKMSFFVAACAAIIFTGDYVYDNPYFSVAYNRFHVTQTTKDVCDAIIIEGREVRAVFPSEMMSYVRQYTANVCMPYGREMVVNTWNNDNPLYDAMEAVPISCEEVAKNAAEQSCHYIIVHEWKKLSGDFEEYGYHLQDTVDGYRIYKWEHADF